MAFERDRIDGTSALRQLQIENVSVRINEAMIILRLSPEHDVDLYFPAPSGAVNAVWLELAADVLSHLTAIDNEVQRVGAEQWAGSPYPSSHYEGQLAYITLTEAGEAVLRYFVIGCNSEWDEHFVRTDDRWVREP